MTTTEGRPLVTVLLPVHNGADHLRESVESILAQSFRDFELLVIDDGSTDATPAILAGFSDERLRILANDRNLGLTPTLNRGIAESHGAYIARQDADDLSDPSRLAAQVARLEADPEIALLGSSHRRIDEAGREQGLRLVPTDATAIRWRLLFLSAFSSSVMIRAAILAEVGGYDERFRYAEDYELLSRIARSHGVAALAEPLVSYRRTGSSMTATFADVGAQINTISAANIDWVLRSAGVRPDELAGLDRDTAWRLLFGDPSGLDPEAAQTVAPLILDLQEAFAVAYGLDAEAAHRHRIATARRLAGRIGRLGLRRHDARACLAAAGLLLSHRTGARRANRGS